MAWKYDGSKLRELRRAAGYADNLRDLGADAGCSYQILRLYELNYREPPTHRLVALAALLGVNVQDFFVETEDVPA